MKPLKFNHHLRRTRMLKEFSFFLSKSTSPINQSENQINILSKSLDRRYKILQRAWTLLELLITISIIGIILGFFVPPIVSRITMNAKINATRRELYQLRQAIVGNPEIVAGGEYADLGFYGDVGRYPRHLIELVTNRPDTTNFVYPGREAIPVWDPFTKRGWHGPYVRDDGAQGFLYDAWDMPYRIMVDNLGTPIGIKSAGPDGRWFGEAGVTENDDITVLF